MEKDSSHECNRAQVPLHASWGESVPGARQAAACKKLFPLSMPKDGAGVEITFFQRRFSGDTAVMTGFADEACQTVD
jgi:hypothetical protein